MSAEYECYKDKRGEFRFRLKAGNGETIFTGEGYKSKSSCTNGIKSVQKNSADDSRYEVKEAKSGKHYFVLKAGNNQVIGQSQMYDSAASAKTGMASVKKNGATTKIDDHS